MPIVLYQKMPPEATIEMIEAVTEEMDVRNLPPNGLIVHTAVNIGGKTFGMALLGLRVVRRDGGMAGPRRAVVRTLVFPLSFLLCGLGFTGILLGNQRRALHDLIARTAVVYAWDARTAHLRFLAGTGAGRRPLA